MPINIRNKKEKENEYLQEYISEPSYDIIINILTYREPNANNIG